MSIDIKHLWPALAAVAVIIPVQTNAAEAEAYMAPQAAAATLADGAPWSAEAPSGRTFKLTLKKDGTGSIRGGLPFPMSVKWTVKGDAVCLTGTMMSKCLRFRAIPGGLQGYVEDKPDLKLSR